MFLASILYYILLGIGVILFSIIFIPYEYYVFGEKLDENYIKGSLSWLFGGVRVGFCKYPHQSIEARLTILGIKKKISIKKKLTDTKNKHLKRDSNIKKYLNRDLLKKAVCAFISVFNHCKPDKVFVNARVGFEDPLYTGLLYAVKSLAYKYIKKYNVTIQAVFDEEIIEGKFFIRGRIWLAYLILIMVGFLITKPFRNILISNVKMKIKGGI